MTKLSDQLNERLKKTENSSSKMALMARQSANGQLTSFSGLFGISELSEPEKKRIESILTAYAIDDHISSDLSALLSITSEVKAINNQAALLHGERIKKAHSILIKYREGAFTAWLIATYGNRQTPYNLMQYYEFCEAMPKSLRMRIEMMPRQALYTLASREGDLQKKQSIVENYRGETKIELLNMIRAAFPLDEKDRRIPSFSASVIKALEKILNELTMKKRKSTMQEKTVINHLLEKIQKAL